ncbi:hypothetical protein [Emticicia sp. TH156]|uniref:hypothetical protein n=1 Tax=Emticicia sp. TH156 TaxID=2067454 RepID=UPI000C7683F3|nr:hypothetical protein [Emticicia sp. TH156]PLK44586.1 hypothetical protein C0V77_08950 [Emticicia sp. TH156]
MKIPLLLIITIGLVQHVRAQLAYDTNNGPSPLLINKKMLKPQGRFSLPERLPDTLFLKKRLLFSRYIPDKSAFRPLSLADGAMAALNPATTSFNLEQSRNRTKQLFYKMKMWRYFK